MSYTTPVTDRTLSDVTNKTSKGYFNVADWDRILHNIEYCYGIVNAALPTNVTFYGMPDGDRTYIPRATDDDTGINNLLGRLNTLIQAIEDFGVSISDVDVVFANWIAGATEDAPDYQDVNTWEQTIQLIHDFFQYTQRHARTGIASCGSGLTWNNRFRR